MASNIENGILKIKNVSGSPYQVVELANLELADQEEIDMLDTELDTYYGSFSDAKRAAVEMETALKQAVDAGDLEITQIKPPVMKRRR